MNTSGGRIRESVRERRDEYCRMPKAAAQNLRADV